ncbi:hypothetical protein OEZ86_004739 [Tetradesmus obliquus]|nr:hypothetical protein OEZ86_004739 [Tetradesmus obliquus]
MSVGLLGQEEVDVFELAFVAVYARATYCFAVGLAGVISLVAAPIVSMGLLGQEEVGVFEVRPARDP